MQQVQVCAEVVAHTLNVVCQGELADDADVQLEGKHDTMDSSATENNEEFVPEMRRVTTVVVCC